MSFNPKAPFDGLPLLAQKGDLVNKMVLKACGEARAALASPKQATALNGVDVFVPRAPPQPGLATYRVGKTIHASSNPSANEMAAAASFILWDVNRVMRSPILPLGTV